MTKIPEGHLSAITIDMKKGKDDRNELESHFDLALKEIEKVLNKTVLGTDTVQQIIDYAIKLEKSGIDVVGIGINTDLTIDIFIANKNIANLPKAKITNYSQAKLKKAIDEDNDCKDCYKLGRGTYEKKDLLVIKLSPSN